MEGFTLCNAGFHTCVISNLQAKMDALWSLVKPDNKRLRFEERKTECPGGDATLTTLVKCMSECPQLIKVDPALYVSDEISGNYILQIAKLVSNLSNWTVKICRNVDNLTLEIVKVTHATSATADIRKLVDDELENMEASIEAEDKCVFRLISAMFTRSTTEKKIRNGIVVFGRNRTILRKMHTFHLNVDLKQSYKNVEQFDVDELIACASRFSIRPSKQIPGFVVAYDRPPDAYGDHHGEGV